MCLKTFDSKLLYVRCLILEMKKNYLKARLRKLPSYLRASLQRHSLSRSEAARAQTGAAFGGAPYKLTCLHQLSLKTQGKEVWLLRQLEQVVCRALLLSFLS